MTGSSLFPTRPSHRLVPLALLLLAAADLYGQQAISADLQGSAEVPAVTTTATGVARITVLPDYSVSGTVQTAGMLPTQAHIHEGPVGSNGPVVITLTKITTDSFIVPPSAALSEAQYAQFIAGNLYVNVHSDAYPNGEIRAQLLGTATASTPMRPAY